jgi:hypothetical protein
VEETQKVKNYGFWTRNHVIDMSSINCTQFQAAKPHRLAVLVETIFAQLEYRPIR